MNIKEYLSQAMWLDRIINNKLQQLDSLKYLAQKVTASLDNMSYRLLLEMRYIGGQSWVDVASNIGYDVRTVFRIHGEALKEIEKIKMCQ
ncbi:hypothetical protein EAL2_c19340 [Peptoclostridium acidaminophilum DSM 3953]|uniref:RNA polymerase sigma-70 region 4 domain-containing protein n=1 Tax=Peptoclostridium acidaminophilum DSM 3953 TaxID=1286171 RepID=W8T8N2_PEPAC|nr:hypothetical protein [Peptoclostridium acidaminophilum]AHM57215.1 hypothetical protein EAL2_c19340 [Peptoclostridium acidaminophilum DSM 3953]